MRKHYASRRDTLLAVLDRELGNWLTPIVPGAGIHLYARYRDRRHAPRIASLTAQYAAGARDAGAFLLARRAGASSGAGIAFGFGCIDEEEIEASIARLARAIGRT
jgi:DNA-binding transcriptional MocR family regulator